MLLLHRREIKGNGLGKDGLKKWSIRTVFKSLVGLFHSMILPGG